MFHSVGGFGWKENGIIRETNELLLVTCSFSFLCNKLSTSSTFVLVTYKKVIKYEEKSQVER